MCNDKLYELLADAVSLLATFHPNTSILMEEKSAFIQRANYHLHEYKLIQLKRSIRSKLNDPEIEYLNKVGVHLDV